MSGGECHQKVGISALNRKAGIDLKPVHVRKAAYLARIPDRTLDELRNMLDDEYRFLDKLKENIRV